MKTAAKVTTYLLFLLLLLLTVVSPEVLGFLQKPPPCSSSSLGRRTITSSRSSPIRRNNQDQILLLSPTTSNRKLLRGGHAAAAAASPAALRTWMVPALASALSYALYNLSMKMAGSSGLSPLLGGVILQVVAALLGSILLLFSKAPVAATISKQGIVYSVGAGLFVGAAELLSLQVAATGAQASQSVPVMIGGSVAIGSVLGVVLLRERMSWQGWLGVLLVVAGVALVAMDG